MTDEGKLSPIDGTRWGNWNREGAIRWDVVSRSWGVFVLNTTDFVNLLKRPATDFALSTQLMGDDREAVAWFWGELDQRLHNQLAGAVSLVDHTRRLTKYYAKDAPLLVADFERRNGEVFAMDDAAFLRALRNYLLHYGTAPVVQTQSLSMTEGGMTGHSIKLGASHLLSWDGWPVRAREYLEKFSDRDGPTIAPVVVSYANAMSQLYTWLFGERAKVMRTPPERFRMSPHTDD